MRVAIDWNLCIGSGLCVKVAGNGLQLAPYHGEPRAILSGNPPDDLLLSAARACPTMAIRLVDEVGQLLYPPPPAV